jgi:diamine N-acetyltransferase
MAKFSADIEVTLRDIDSANVRAICDLAVAPDQVSFVAPNAVSMAEYAVTTKAWTRAIYADDDPVGYVLLSDDDDRPRYYLWRFMIDQRYRASALGSEPWIW